MLIVHQKFRLHMIGHYNRLCHIIMHNTHEMWDLIYLHAMRTVPIIFNKLENFNSILNYTIDGFTPSGNLSYMNQHGEILHHTPLREVFNLRCYIQHLMNESEDKTQNPLSHENWMKQNNWKFIKYVIHHRHPMTPVQLKQKLFEEIFKHQHEKVDTDEGESIEEEDKSNIKFIMF